MPFLWQLSSNLMLNFFPDWQNIWQIRRCWPLERWPFTSSHNEIFMCQTLSARPGSDVCFSLVHNVHMRAWKYLYMCLTYSHILTYPHILTWCIVIIECRYFISNTLCQNKQQNVLSAIYRTHGSTVSACAHICTCTTAKGSGTCTHAVKKKVNLIFL